MDGCQLLHRAAFNGHTGAIRTPLDNDADNRHHQMAGANASRYDWQRLATL